MDTEGERHRIFSCRTGKTFFVIPSLLPFVNNFLSFFSSLSPSISCLNGIMNWLSYILILITLQEGWKFQFYIFFGCAFSHYLDTCLLCFPFTLIDPFEELLMKSVDMVCVEPDSFIQSLSGCSWELRWQRYPFRWKSIKQKRLLIVSFLGRYQTSRFQLVGPNLMSSPFEPCQGVWFWLALEALGSEMDEYSNDSCPGPHSHQDICGEDKESWVSQFGGPADSMVWLQPTAEHIGF